MGVFDTDNALSHSLCMDYVELVRAIRERLGEKVTQAELAERFGVTQPTISRWLKGATPETENHQRIFEEARTLGLLSAEDYTTEPQASAGGTIDKPRVVRVVGYVGAGAEGHYYAVAQDNLDEIAAPEWATKDTVAMEIRGESLGSLFDRWLVFFDDVRRPVTPDLIGKLCVVWLPDDRVLIKKLRRGGSGLFDLLSNSGDEPIRGVAVESGAKVRGMVPR